ncbi:MAG: TonB-dependent receptor [Flavobacteriaceae bacterium]
MKKKYYLWLVLLLLNITMVLAQEKLISGSVLDENEIPLNGVNIIVKGTSVGTQTDFDGNYSVKASVGQTLVFSYVSFETKEIEITSNLVTLNLTMIEIAEAIGEVVITGFGRQSKRKNIDAISTVNAEQIKEVSNSNFQNALTGKLSGVQINQANGKAEGKITFNIRGVASLSGNQEPLYVVDGVPIISDQESGSSAPTNPLLNINANDIESVSVLKDASSAAIYGSRGTNGVVIITTKSGKNGKAKISFRSSYGYSEAVNKRKWLNADQYVELYTEAATNAGQTEAQIETALDDLATDDLGNISDWRNGNIDTNWQNEALVDGSISELSFSMSGGDDKSSYFMSLGSNNTDGIVRGNSLERYNFRLNASRKLSNRLEAGANISIARSSIDRISADRQFTTPLQAVALVPISPTHNSDGTLNGNTLYDNFLFEEEFGYFKTNIWNLGGVAFGEYSILEDLKFRSELGYEFFNQTEETFSGSEIPRNGGLSNGAGRTVSRDFLTFNNYATYDKIFADVHDVNLVVGMSYEENNRKGISVQGDSFANDLIQTVAGATNITGGSTTRVSNKLVSYFGRVTYSYNNKYLLKGSMRVDGSSRFGPNNRYGYFPSVSAGWIATNEVFLEESSTVSFLKLRGSWGITGNQPLGSFDYLSRLGSGSYDVVSGQFISVVGDADLGWEETTQLNFGLDYGLFNNVVTGEFDYYVKDTKDLLLNARQPLSTGIAGNVILTNIGEVKNTGIEFSINTKNITRENFSWNTNFNISYNKNEIIKLVDGDDIFGSAGERDYSILREGESFGAFYLVEYAGVDPENGDALYFTNTELEDGSIERLVTNDYSEASRIVVGKALPDWIGGMTNTLRYRDLDFSFTFQGQWGAQIYNSAGLFQASGFAGGRDNQSIEQLDRWQQPGDITDVPRADLNGDAVESTRYLQDADFIRLRNLTIGYNFKNLWNIDMIRVYFSGLNLLTFTDYDGWDPEATRDDLPGSFARGYEFYSAPPAKVYTFGINVDL